MLTSGAYGYMLDYIVGWLLLLSWIAHTWCFFRFFPLRRFRRSGLLVGNSLVLGCLAGIVAIAWESHLRFVAVETDSFGMSLPARRWFLLHTRLNSLGCRDEEWSPSRPAGSRRIAFVGDSFTYGWGIKRADDRLTEMLERKFGQREDGSPAVSIMNVSKPGWDTSAEAAAIEQLLRGYEVDEIVLCYVPNDIEKLLPVTESFNPIVPPQPTFFNLDSSCLLEYLYNRLIVPRLPVVRDYGDWLADGFDDEQVWRQHQQQLTGIVRLCRDRGVALRAVILPFLRSRGVKYQADRVHGMLRQFFATHEVPVADLLDVVQERDVSQLVVNRGDAHPNEKAHALFAARIWESFYATPDELTR